jgi:hypothetical protein
VFYFTNFNKISLNWFAIKLETLVKHFELSACKYRKISTHKKKDKIKEIKVE